jgi:hypothetical protein
MKIVTSGRTETDTDGMPALSIACWISPTD